MNWIEQLSTLKPGDGSAQIGEDRIAHFIFDHIKVTNRHFLDIGAGFYGHGHMSNTNLLKKDGWTGLRIDANNDDDDTIHKLYVTPDNIVPFLKQHNVPYGFDFMSIDIDSFDLDILEAVVPTYQPRLICTEFNPALDPVSSVKLKYEEGYIWNETTKYGYSFGAAVTFCGRYGYKILLNHQQQNLFLVRGDIIQQTPVIEVKQTFYHPPDNTAEWVQY